MRLSAARRPERKDDGAVLLQLDRGALDTAGARHLFRLGKDRHVPGSVSPAWLDANDDPDPEQASLGDTGEAGLACLGLFPSHSVVVHVYQNLVEQRLVVAAAVYVAVGCGVGERVGADEVAAA